MAITFSKITKFITGLLLDFFTILFCFFLVELISILVNTVMHPNFRNPYTFTIVWIVLILLIPYLIMAKKGLEIGKYLSFLFFLSLVGGLCLVATKFASEKLIKHKKFEIIHPKYVAISGEDVVDHSTLMEEGTEMVSTNGYVFNKYDNHIFSEISKTKIDHEDFSLNNYIFWQSAMADGYDPKYISSYRKNNKLELIFTVGPLRILESFISTITNSILFLIIPVAMRLFGNPIFFSEYSSLKKIFYRKK